MYYLLLLTESGLHLKVDFNDNFTVNNLYTADYSTTITFTQTSEYTFNYIKSGTKRSMKLTENATGNLIKFCCCFPVTSDPVYRKRSTNLQNVINSCVKRNNEFVNCPFFAFSIVMSPFHF